MSTTFTLNRDQVIKGALRLCGVIGEGETPTTEQINNASEQFNALVKYLGTMGLPLWAIRKSTKSFIAGQVEYDSAADWSLSDRPLELLACYLHDVNSLTDIPIETITRSEYSTIGNKTSASFPVQVWFEPRLTSSKFTFYPAPSTAAAANKEFVFYYQIPFADMTTSGTDVVDFPNEWILPLTYQLAVHLGVEYSVPSGKMATIKALADETYDQALSYGEEQGSIFFQPDDMWRNW